MWRLSEQEILPDIWKHLVTSLHNIHKIEKKASPYHNIKLLFIRTVGYFKKGNMGSHTIVSELVIHHEAMRLFGKQSPYKVSNYCQLRRT